MNALTRRLERNAGLKMAVGVIANFEGGMSRDGRFHAYWDRDGRVWTIGYGDTQNVRPGMIWSAAKARRMLRRRLARDYAPALDALRLPLKRHMYAATLSFLWNLGVGMLDPSHDFGREMRAHHWRRASESLDEYVTSGGHRLQGLVNRRNAEQALFDRDI